MGKVRIFVCGHKPVAGIRHNEVYQPLHVGRAVSECQEEMADFIGDDTGDSISERSAHYSELTGTYWIWKNVHDCEYVGLVHYRRDFGVEFTNENIAGFFADGTDVVMAEPFARPRSRYIALLSYVQLEDFVILRSVMNKICPEYLPTLNSFLRDYLDHPFNMVVCRKELFDQYAEWLFSIMFEMEKYVRYSPYTNSSRVFGYVGELLTPVFFIHNRKKIKGMKVLMHGKRLQKSVIRRMAAHFLHQTVWRIRRNDFIGVDPSVYRGLVTDGIMTRKELI